VGRFTRTRIQDELVAVSAPTSVLKVKYLSDCAGDSVDAPLPDSLPSEPVASHRGFEAGMLALCQSSVAPCYTGFELSADCVTTRGLDQKAAVYRRRVREAMTKLGASYDIRLRLGNHPVEAGDDAVTTGGVFRSVRNEEMRNQSFIINVTADFLERQPEILFEASSLHEVCQIMNDDLVGYQRNGANIEAAEEYCVLQMVANADNAGVDPGHNGHAHSHKISQA
jgi:hypothetical protein